MYNIFAWLIGGGDLSVLLRPGVRMCIFEGLVACVRAVSKATK